MLNHGCMVVLYLITLFWIMCYALLHLLGSNYFAVLLYNFYFLSTIQGYRINNRVEVLFLYFGCCVRIYMVVLLHMRNVSVFTNTGVANKLFTLANLTFSTGVWELIISMSSSLLRECHNPFLPPVFGIKATVCMWMQLLFLLLFVIRNLCLLWKEGHVIYTGVLWLIRASGYSLSRIILV